MDLSNIDYGTCTCGYKLSPYWTYVQDIYDPKYARQICAYLLCDACGETFIVDDTFDLPTNKKWKDISDK